MGNSENGGEKQQLQQQNSIQIWMYRSNINAIA